MSLPDPQHNSQEDQVNTTKDSNQEDMENVSRNQENDTRSDDASCCETHIVSPAAASCQDDEEGNSTTTIESRQDEINNAARQQEDASIVELEQEVLMERYRLMQKYIILLRLTDYLKKSHQQVP